MARVLVQGGSGLLGRAVVPRLIEAGHEVTVTSRRERPAVPGGPVYLRADLASGEGLESAVQRARPEVVVNLATSPVRGLRQTDVDGALLLARGAMRVPGFKNFIQIGIVGDDLIPFRYYKAKTAAEAILGDLDGLPLTVQRATQFHDLIGVPLLKLRWLPLAFLPTDFKFQPVDSQDVAARLVELVAAEPANGRASDVGGPEVRTLGELARTAGLKRVARLPMPGAVADGFRKGLNTCPDRAVGEISFANWVERQGQGSR